MTTFVKSFKASQSKKATKNKASLANAIRREQSAKSWCGKDEQRAAHLVSLYCELYGNDPRRLHRLA